MIDEGLRAQFPGAAGYLNTASLGLPPQAAIDALSAAMAAWQAGDAEAPAYDVYVSSARAAFAAMTGVPSTQVAVGAQVSALVGMAVTMLEPGSRVLCPEGEFTSVLFPFLAVRDGKSREPRYLLPEPGANGVRRVAILPVGEPSGPDRPPGTG